MKNIFLVCFALCLVQCSFNRTLEPIGPAACPSEHFAVVDPFVFEDAVTSNTAQLDLIASHAVISASFNEVINYKVSVKGVTSGAEYFYFGRSNRVDLHWYGNSTNGKYFKQGETLTCKLTNICKQEPLGTGQMTLLTVVGFNAGFGLKVINFEDVPAVVVNTSLSITATTMTPSSPGYMPSPQGGNYRHYEGTSANLTWYFGNQEITGINYTSLGTDPTRVYLNFFAKGDPNSQCFMDIYERVQSSLLRRKFPANVSDQWKLYSVKLSDIGIINPSEITNFMITLQSATTQDKSAAIDVDLIIFTFDKPF